MKTFIIASISILILVCGCSNLGSTSRPGSPNWVSTRISQYQNAPVGNPPQSIWQYQYNGKTVYYTPSQCCDQFSHLYDGSGNLICAPDGGFTGAGDGKCPDFFKARKNELLIWRDSRNK